MYLPTCVNENRISLDLSAVWTTVYIQPELDRRANLDKMFIGWNFPKASSLPQKPASTFVKFYQ